MIGIFISVMATFLRGLSLTGQYFIGYSFEVDLQIIVFCVCVRVDMSPE